jgi:hypothetical protein
VVVEVVVVAGSITVVWTAVVVGGSASAVDVSDEVIDPFAEVHAPRTKAATTTHTTRGVRFMARG